MSLTSSLYSIMHPLLVLLVNYILINYGLRPTIVLGSVLNIAGVGVRLFIGQGFAFVVAGSVVASAGHVFVVSAPLKFATSWFRAERWPIVIAVSLQLLMGGGAIGGFMPVLFVGKDST